MDGTQDLSLANRRAVSKAFDFIDHIRNMEDVKGLRTAFAIEARHFGFDYYMVATVEPGESRTLRNTVLDSWPQDWFNRYIERGYAAFDPIILELTSNFLPFTWQRLAEQGKIFDTGKAIFDEAKAWQMHRGLCIPLRSLEGLNGAISLAGLEPDLSTPAQGAVHLMAIYFHAKLVELSGPTQVNFSFSSLLTPRERECVKWIAMGKTSWEIGEILGLRELTIAAYIKTAMQKLNVVSRAQLVAMSIKLGEITL